MRIAIASGIGLSIAAAPAIAVPSNFAEQAAAVMGTSYPADAPGAAVIVMEDGKIVYSAGRGLADVAGKAPITADTVFRLGSITKQFTAATVLKLVEEGKLSLADPLSKFLPDYPKPGADATVAQLLNHTSGIQSYTGIPGWMAGPKPAQEVTSDSLIAEFKDMPVEFERGTKWDYNNSGYVLLGAIIEKVTGKAWHEAIAEKITRPLRLTSIRYGVGEEQVAGMAKGHTMDGGTVAPARPIHMSVPHAAGALVGNARDLAKWSYALHHGKVVANETYKEMIAKTRLADGTETPYGFGIGLADVRDRVAIAHGGGIFGFSTYALYLPSDDLFVAVLANSDEPKTSPTVTSLRLAALAIGNPYPDFTEKEVPARELEPLFGAYKSELAERQFFAKEGKLFTRRAGGPEMRVFAAGEDRFFYGNNSLTWFKVTRESSGKHVMKMYHGGGDEAESSTRIGPVPAEPPPARVSRPELERLVGSYMGPAPIVVAIDGDGHLTLKFGSQPITHLVPESATMFRVKEIDAKVSFQLAGDKVGGLTIHQGGRDLPAKRVD